MRQIWRIYAFLAMLWVGGELCLGAPTTSSTTPATPTASTHQQKNNSVESIKSRERVYQLSGQNYILQYTTGDDTLRLERGGLEEGVWVVRGSVTTLREDGRYHTLYYLADQLGYRTTEALSDNLEEALSRHWQDGVLVDEDGVAVDRIGDSALNSLIGGG